MVEVFFSDNDGLIARLIKSFTWSHYCHVGFYDRQNGTVIDSDFSRHGVSEYSFDELKKNYPRILLRTFPNVPRSVLEVARGQIGKPYDLTAILGIGIHRNWQDPRKWFCAEFLAWSCAQTGVPIINKESWRVTPQDVLEVSSAGLFE